MARVLAIDLEYASEYASEQSDTDSDSKVEIVYLDDEESTYELL